MGKLLPILIGILLQSAHIALSKPLEVKDASSTIQSNQQTTGIVSGFANSTAQGNGTPNSAVAYAWQGGQTSAQGAQSATAENGVAQAGTNGTSTCLQGYMAHAGGPNSTQADSSGNATCITTYSEDGTQNTALERKIRPPVITMNSSLAQLGEGVSEQSHGSLSSVGGPSGGALSIYAGGFANTPQVQMSVLQSNIDALGSPSVAQQEVSNEQNLDADEETFISLGGGHFNHMSGGLSSVQGLGTSFNNAWNSHAETEDEDEIDNEAENDS